MTVPADFIIGSRVAMRGREQFLGTVAEIYSKNARVIWDFRPEVRDVWCSVDSLVLL